ncbi:MAG: hypothetical protein QM791_20850 [Ferruginibacter sp.]
MIAEIELINGTLKFNGKPIPNDSLVSTDIGNVRCIINPQYKKDGFKNIKIQVVTLAKAVDILKNNFNISPISKFSSILDLTYSDVLQERAVDILRNIINIYGTSTIDYKSRIYEKSERFLDERLQLVSEELNKVEKNLQAFKTSEGIVDLSSEGEVYLNQLKQTDRTIAEIDIKLDVLSQVNSYVTKRNNSNDSVPATLGLDDPVLITLLGQLYQTETELKRTKTLTGAKNPAIEVLEDNLRKLRPSIITSINNLKANLMATKDNLERQNNMMKGSLNKIPLKERLLLDITRQQAVKNAIYTFLLQKREESAIAAASIIPNYRVIEKPREGGMTSLDSMQIYLIYVGFPLLLIFLYIYIQEFSGRKILFRFSNQ